MTRLPAGLLLVAIPLVLATASEASAGTEAPLAKQEMLSVATSFKGTFLFTQQLDLPAGDPLPAGREGGMIPFVDVSHIDENLEIRTLSGVFHESGCGKVLAAGAGSGFVVPFNASMGVGDFSVTRDWSIRAVYIHVLYDCGGTPIGYAWVSRTGSPLWEVDVLPPGGEAPPDQPPTGSKWDSDFVGWDGQTTIRFFDLNGEPLVVPIPGLESGLTEISGPFRALRVTGEPHR